MASPTTATRYDPSASDPRIVAALDARDRLGAAFRDQDADAVDALFAPDLVVHAPSNAVLPRETVMARFRGGAMHYSPDETVNDIEFAGVRGDYVVLMGKEIVKPLANAPHAGKTVHRRFTDIWKEVGGTWKLVLRQATITSLE